MERLYERDKELQELLATKNECDRELETLEQQLGHKEIYD